MGEHYEGVECLQPDKTGLWERGAEDFCASQSNSRPGGGAESVERSRSPGSAGNSGAVGGLEVSVSCSREYTEL